MADHRDRAIEVEVEDPDPFRAFLSEAALIPTPAATQLTHTRRTISTLQPLPFRHAGRPAIKFGLSIFGCGVAAGALMVGVVSRDAPPTVATATIPQTTIAQPSADAVQKLPPSSPVGTSSLPAAPPTLTRSENPAVPTARERPARLRGTLVVNSNPSGGRVFINSEFAGLTPLVLRALPAGSRAVGVRLDGYTSWSRGVSIVANKSTTVVAQLTRPAPLAQ